MYVEVRKRGAKKLYYLAHSFRMEGRVKKIRKYLGADLEEERLSFLTKKAEKELLERSKSSEMIGDPLHTVLSEDEKRSIEDLIRRKGRGLEVLHLSEEDWMRFTEDFAYNTNAIEGSSVTSTEVRGMLKSDRWPVERSRQEISETYGVAEAVKYIRKTKEHLSIPLIRELHKIVFSNSLSYAGNFREKGVEVAVVDGSGNVMHRGAPQKDVVRRLRELAVWYSRSKDAYHPIVLAGVVHNQFENIHPFRDGNGRVGRLLLNNILLRHGLPPVNIEIKNRSEYYGTLQAYEKEGNIRSTIELILKEYRNLRHVTTKK